MAPPPQSPPGEEQLLRVLPVAEQLATYPRGRCIIISVELWTTLIVITSAYVNSPTRWRRSPDARFPGIHGRGIMHLRDDTGHDYEWSGGGGHGAEITRTDDTFIGPVNPDAQTLI